MRLWDSVFDNHMHLRKEGYNVEAAKQFEKAGGTSFNLVNLPDYSFPPQDYYENVYSSTISMAERVKSETGVKVIVSLGPYPLDYLHFRESVDDIAGFVKAGIDLALKYITEGKASAIGEIGRPHFETDEKAVQDSNSILEYAMEGAAGIDAPVILHTEDLDEAAYASLRMMAERAGLSRSKLIKHHAHPGDFSIDRSIVKSILASRSNVREALSISRSFFLETDYVDEKEKPGKVIPADSVPRRAVMIKSQYPEWEEIFSSIFQDLPKSVYGVDWY